MYERPRNELQTSSCTLPQLSSSPLERIKLLSTYKENKMISVVPWIEITIVGFAYLAAAFFLFLSAATKYRLDFLKDLHEYIPYIAVGVLFLSYAVGLSAHFLMEKGIIILRPECKYNATSLLLIRQKAPAQILEAFGSSYSNLIMFRHLTIATALLSVTIFIWLSGSVHFSLRWHFCITCLLFSFLFLFAWRIHSADHAQLRDEVIRMYAL